MDYGTRARAPGYLWRKTYCSAPPLCWRRSFRSIFASAHASIIRTRGGFFMSHSVLDARPTCLACRWKVPTLPGCCEHGRSSEMSRTDDLFTRLSRFDEKCRNVRCTGLLVISGKDARLASPHRNSKFEERACFKVSAAYTFTRRCHGAYCIVQRVHLSAGCPGEACDVRATRVPRWRSVTRMHVSDFRPRFMTRCARANRHIFNRAALVATA